MNEELIRQCAREAANGPHGYAHEIAERAIRLYHARAVAPLVDALEMVRDADEDCKRDELPTIPDIARAKIDRALAPFQQEAK